MKLLVVVGSLLWCCVAAQPLCESCPAGNYLNTWTGNCVPCPQGYASSYADQTGAGSAPGSCGICQAGQGTNMDQSRCIDCPAGKLSNAGVCVLCPIGRYQPLVRINDTYNNQSNCLDCPNGTRPSTDRSKCESCPAGTYSTDGVSCVPCQSGTYSKGVGQTYNHCTSCGLGYEPNAGSGATDCNICPAGKYRDFSALFCQQCSYGMFNPKTGSTTPNDCTQCPAGRAPDQIWVVGQLTTVGSKCNECGPGKYSPDGTPCTTCGSGYNPGWGGQNPGDCRTCPLGNVPNSDLSGCVACPIGRYSDDGLWCTSCPINTTQTRTGAKDVSDCKACPTGKVNGYQSAYPCVCNGGQYEVRDLNTPCLQCPLGKTSIRRTYDSFRSQWIGGTVIDASPDGCTFCAPGTYGVVDNTTGTPFGVCWACQDGWYNPNTGSTNVTDCQQCQDGSYSNAPNNANCTQCIPGKYGDPSHTRCNNCQAGKASNVVGASTSSTCANCTAGSYSMAGATQCRSCPPGTYSALNSDSCVPCDIDTFNNQSGASDSSSCLACPSGRALMRESSGRGHWVPSPWRNCSSSCSTTRDVVCANSLLQQVPDSECLAGTKPVTWAVCAGNPNFQYFSTNANRCPRACSANTDTGKTVTCVDGTCVTDPNDCPYGNRLIFRQRINYDVSPKYQTSPSSILTWIATYENYYYNALSNAAQIHFLLLTPVNWRGVQSVEVTVQIQQMPYPDNLYYPTTTNRRASGEFVNFTTTTASACFLQCQNNASCVAVSWYTGAIDNCRLSNIQGTLNGWFGWSYIPKQVFPNLGATATMFNNYVNRVTSGALYGGVPSLDPSWGFDWAPTPAPFSTNSASTASMGMTRLLQVLSLGFLLKFLY